MARRDFDFDEDEPPAEEVPKVPRKKEIVHEDERDLRGLALHNPTTYTETEKTPAAARIAYFIATLCITFAFIFKVLYELNHP